MSSISKSEISGFESAFQLLIRTARATVNNINTNPRDLAIFCQNLSHIKEKNNKIHIIGTGLSGYIAKIIGECLKDLRFNVSIYEYSPTDSIQRGDTAIAITGSGWTTFTTLAIENFVRNKVKILTFSGNKESKAAKMSDTLIHIPLGFIAEDQQFYSEESAPISPLGTIFELTTMVIGLGIINGIFSGSCTNGFNSGTANIISYADQTINTLLKGKELIEFLLLIKNYCNNGRKKIYLTGEGISRCITDFISIRLQRLNINVCSIDDWRFRTSEDLLIAVSGSGQSLTSLNAVKIAKKENMRIVCLSSFLDSEIASDSDLVLHILGRSQKISSNSLKLTKPSIYLPSFEYTTALLFEAIIAQIAFDLGLISEEI